MLQRQLDAVGSGHCQKWEALIRHICLCVTCVPVPTTTTFFFVGWDRRMPPPYGQLPGGGREASIGSLRVRPPLGQKVRFSLSLSDGPCSYRGIYGAGGGCGWAGEGRRRGDNA